MAQENGVPSGDGEITRYTPDPELAQTFARDAEAEMESEPGRPGVGDVLIGENLRRLGENRAPTRPRAATGGRRRVIYVNGMITTGEEHRRTARLLASLTNTPVTGIYNRTDGGPIDFFQSANDYLNPVTALSETLGGAALRSVTSEEHRQQMARAYLRTGANDATLQLFDTVYGLVRNDWNVIIVCHSQGNLITSNMLWVLRWVRENRIGIHVYGLASPAPSWPSARGLHVRLYEHVNDPVTWFSYPLRSLRTPTPARRQGASWWDGESWRPDPIRPHGVDSHPRGYIHYRRFQEDLLGDLAR